MTMIIDGTNGVTYPNTGVQALPAFPGAGTALYENAQTISASYTVTSGRSAVMVGPVTLASGAILTIPNGSRVVLL